MRTLREIVDGVPAWVGTTLGRSNQPADAADIYWDGDYAGMTQYSGSGTYTVTEKTGLLSVATSAAGSSDNVQAALIAHSFSVGDRFSVPVRWMADEADTFYLGVIFADGTASGSNAIAAIIQQVGGNTYLRTYIRRGTLGAMTSVNANQDIRNITPAMVGLEYDASNSFKFWISPDGVSWTELGHAAQSNTMTPTHVGVVWHAVSADDTVFTFGPLLRHN